MLLKFVFSFGMLLFINYTATAQSHEHSSHDSNHEHHKNEIGIANAPVYFLKEKGINYGLHVHYIRNITHTKFGLGAGYERVFDVHKHNTFSFVSSYRPIERLCINLAPGITFEGEEINTPFFSLHFETSYEIEINNFHIGPVFEIAYDPEDYHISLGLHVGFGF